MTEIYKKYYFIDSSFPAEFGLDIADYLPQKTLIDALKGNRVEQYKFELLDESDNYQQDLTTVKGGYIEKSVFNTIRSGGALEIVDDGTINFYSDRIRVKYMLLVNGSWEEFSLGVFLLATPGKSTDGKAVLREVQMYDKLLVLDQDAVDSSYTIAAGTVVTNAIKTVIQEAGETKINITPSDETLPAAKTWPAGTIRLQIVNDLLASINYFSLWADGNGYYRGEPYIAPDNRPVKWTFKDDSEGLYLPEHEIDIDLFNVPNKVIARVSNPEQEELIATATNEDPNSPYSYQSRGRWITKIEDVEATSQDVLDSKAERLLKESTQVAESVFHDHALIPGLELHNAVRFVNSITGTDAKYTIVKQRLELKAGSLMQSEIRRVIT